MLGILTSSLGRHWRWKFLDFWMVPGILKLKNEADEQTRKKRKVVTYGKTKKLKAIWSESGKNNIETEWQYNLNVSNKIKQNVKSNIKKKNLKFD